MTGRELILFILENKLEDEEIIKDGVFIGFMNIEEAAAKFNVGEATIKAWFARNYIQGVKIGDSLFFLRNVEDPRIKRRKTLLE